MRPAPRVPTRAELDARPRRQLREGGPGKADLLIIELPDGPAVVKDFAHKSWLTRIVGRIQIARECAAYRRLGARDGLPRFLGRVDRHALILERVPGRSLIDAPERVRDGAARLAELTRVVEGLHRAGVVHWDLRARDNVLFGASGDVWVVDLASATWLRPGSLAHRALFGAMRLVDRSALLKWKTMLDAGPLTAGEAAFVRRFGRVRRLWIFNPKRRTPEP